MVEIELESTDSCMPLDKLQKERDLLQSFDIL